MNFKAVLLFSMATLVSVAFFPAFQQIGTPVPATFKNAPQKTDHIQWMSLAEVEQALQKEKRKVIVILYSNSCGWCNRLERETLQDENVIRYLNQKYYPIHFNAEEHEKVHFKGKEYKYVQNGQKGYNQLAYELTGGRLSYPTYVFFDENLKLIQSIPGYKSPKDFQTIIKYFGDNFYKKMPWDTYLRQKNSAG